MSMPASMQANERFMGLQALGEQLIPGIPDEITLDHITPKLRWTAFNILSSVSQVWLYAIRSHRVHDVRVRSQLIEPLLLSKFIDSDGFHKVALWGRRAKSFLELPPIPNLEGMFPRCCKLVPIDGKVFILGGMVEPKNGKQSTNKVYVMDLAGRRQWKQCAGMKNSRMRFECGVLKGKIYVFGGLSSDHPVPGAEVYDADENTWSSINPMMSLEYEHRVETVGTELFEHDGINFHPEIFSTMRL